ncbi:c-di-GMP-binding flagellar brake protein YcgR, contains PilZNR and PilZ domains [Halolactibacillus miurensis]|uniref:C-di-GMP-binding flagellar brake protein YcgR, contains PilZNR and PilZ domains n=2 Tax=Halolactibacillus miurensis TaxID=306541 RepID=A0A1I6SW52_9BACI|nr:c-di-GMP-binding flagellar brake protein YcgR, contains PilZNR and PilZ domains [Halolactibacillus miurensis]
MYIGVKWMVKIGTNLTLELNGLDDEVKRFKCRVVEQKQHKLYIDYPINVETNRTDIFPVGTTFQVFYVDDQQMAYRFEGEITGRVKRNVPMLELVYDPKKMKKIQRREYVRINSSMDVALKETQTNKKIVTLTADISGGGMAVHVPQALSYQPGTTFDGLLVFKVNHGGYQYVFVQMALIRMKEEAERHNVMSLKFVSIDEKDREKIIQFCFEEQLRQRRGD